jgi:allantoinase
VEVHDIPDDAVLMPGFVDSHVHANEPGRTEWEGFRTATRAAAAGGVTTMIDMPLNSVPATTWLDALHAKIDAAANQCWVDVGFWGGVVPGNENDLEPLVRAGVLGFKCFLVPSGVPEFGHVTEDDLRRALPVLASNDAVLLAHAELPGPIERALQSISRVKDNVRDYATYLRTRPPEAEVEAIKLLVRLAGEFHARVHIVHVSAAEVLPLIRQAKRAGVQLTAETCPHYLYFDAEQIPQGATEYKCAPPIRDAANREQLLTAVLDGTLDLVASDHSPCPPELKQRETGDFLAAWGGIASLQVAPAVTWTLIRERNGGIEVLAELMSGAPARLAGLERKGAIAVGKDADLVVWGPDAEFAVEGRRLEHRHKLTPYDGQELFGAVRTTYLRGQKVFENGELPMTAPRGQTLLRNKE